MPWECLHVLQASSNRTSRATQSIRPAITLCNADAAQVPSHLSICPVRQDDSRNLPPEHLHCQAG